MGKRKRMPDKKKFNGKNFELVGSSPTKLKSIAKSWAKFNRRVNGLRVRVVKAPYAGYEIYVRKGK